MSTTVGENPIPLIDLDHSTPEELAASISHAVRTIGFLHVRGTNASSAQVKRMFELSKLLFDSPDEEKDAAAYTPADKNGYLRGTRLAEGKGAPDLKENWTYGRYQPPHTHTQQVIPKALQPYREELDAFNTACYETTCRILDAFSTGLGLPEKYLRERHNPGNCGLSLINYPPSPASAAASGAIRASAHKDWGSLTLLFQEEDGTPGLEIFLPDAVLESDKNSVPPYPLGEAAQSKGKWYSAPIVKDTCLVNVGLALELWTQGKYRATLHRVVCHPDERSGNEWKGRRSIAYFVQPTDSVVFNPIQEDGTIKETEGALTSGQFFAQRMAATQTATAKA